MTVKEQQVLDLICSRGGGMNVHELTAKTGMSFEEIHDIVKALIGKGYKIGGTAVGDPRGYLSGWVQRFYLSPYDKNYETLIGGN
jgi:ribulose bisphosphate carboxylase small subunit